MSEPTRDEDERDLLILRAMGKPPAGLGMSGGEAAAWANEEFPALPRLTRNQTRARLQRLINADAAAHGEDAPFPTRSVKTHRPKLAH